MRNGVSMISPWATSRLRVIFMGFFLYNSIRLQQNEMQYKILSELFAGETIGRKKERAAQKTPTWTALKRHALPFTKYLIDKQGIKLKWKLQFRIA